MDKIEAKHMSKILEAYAEGKTVQIRTCDGWKDITENDKVKFCGFYDDYRIKPQPKLRPYANGEEFFEAQKKHGVTVKDSKTWYNIASFNQFGVYLSIGKCYDYVDFLRFYKWADDESPCGIEEIK